MLLLAILLVIVSVAAALLCIKFYVTITVGICTCKERLDGRTVIVTGSNCGIGKEIARDLAARGARVILACRDLQKAREARDDIVATTGNQDVVIRHLDLASLKSVRDFTAGVVASERRLDVLVNNAGASGVPHVKTEDGLELGMAVNHFGPFLLTCLLLDLLKRTGSSRIIMVSSIVHTFYDKSFSVDNINFDKSYDLFQLYGHSKLCNVLMAQYMAEQLRGTGVVANSFHPGIVRTEFMRNVSATIIRTICEMGMSLLCKNAMQGAQSGIHLAVSREGGEITGKYFSDCKVVPSGKATRVPGLAAEVWRRSEELVKLREDERPFK